MRKERLDGTGLLGLLAVTALFAVNQLVIKEVNRGLQPVFFAGIRSALAVGFVWLVLWQRGLLARLRWQDLGPGLVIGVMFSAEFLFLFLALDLTALGRASVIFYSMPLWMALLAHFWIPGERINRHKALGLGAAFVGTAVAILSKSPSGHANLWGDVCALLGAMGWAATAFVARATRLQQAGPEAQLFWMVAVSAPILLLASPFFGPILREVEWYHWGWLLFQAGVVVAGGFIAWLWLLSVYPTSTVASFAFLTPVFAILLGMAWLGERPGFGLCVAALLVALGIGLINRKV